MFSKLGITLNESQLAALRSSIPRPNTPLFLPSPSGESQKTQQVDSSQEREVVQHEIVDIDSTQEREVVQHEIVNVDTGDSDHQPPAKRTKPSAKKLRNGKAVEPASSEDEPLARVSGKRKELQPTKRTKPSTNKSGNGKAVEPSSSDDQPLARVLRKRKASQNAEAGPSSKWQKRKVESEEEDEEDEEDSDMNLADGSELKPLTRRSKPKLAWNHDSPAAIRMRA